MAHAAHLDKTRMAEHFILRGKKDLAQKELLC